MGGQLEFSIARRRAVLSVTQLVRTIRDALELHLDEYWVVGEVSNARVAASNHLYFTLKDARSGVSVVMLNSAYRRLKFRVNDGMEIVVRGRVNLYEARGALQLYAEELEPRGLGALQLAFEQLKRRLESEGLFDPARKRALPFLPGTVGIVTALGGAGLHDILAILLGRWPNLHVIVRPVRVQGAGAAAEIAEALADLNRDGRAEVIICGRGGGSIEDLWAFNEELVARAIFNSEIPVVSAVGHEIDYTIADFVADLRAPTPTAAAQMVVPEKPELARRLDETAAALNRAIADTLGGCRREVSHLATRLKDPLGMLRQGRQRLDESAADLERAITSRLADDRARLRELAAGLTSPAARARETRLHAARLALRLAAAITARVHAARLELGRLTPALGESNQRALIAARRARLAALAAQLDSLSPLRVLERGYAVVVNARDRSTVADARAVEVGDELEIRLMRGRLRARTTAREL